VPLRRKILLLTHFQLGWCEVGTYIYPAKLHTQKFQHNVVPFGADIEGETKGRITSAALLGIRLRITDFFTSQLFTPCPNYLYERTSGHCLKTFRVIKVCWLVINLVPRIRTASSPLLFSPSLPLSLRITNVKTLSTRWSSKISILPEARILWFLQLHTCGIPCSVLTTDPNSFTCCF